MVLFTAGSCLVLVTFWLWPHYEVQSDFTTQLTFCPSPLSPLCVTNHTVCASVRQCWGCVCVCVCLCQSDGVEVVCVCVRVSQCVSARARKRDSCWGSGPRSGRFHPGSRLPPASHLGSTVGATGGRDFFPLQRAGFEAHLVLLVRAQAPCATILRTQWERGEVNY